jgi:hypothetical protein
MHCKLNHLCLSLLLVASGSAFAAGPMRTMPDRDPPQWHTEDTTPQMRYQTSKKEAGAAYEEARRECRSMRGAEAKGCNREARENYQDDLATAKRQLERRERNADASPIRPSRRDRAHQSNRQ